MDTAILKSLDFMHFLTPVHTCQSPITRLFLCQKMP
nr:MAG TPA: hypothetical protein [Caudoviricetes sp.]